MREIKFRVLDANGQMVFSDEDYEGDLGMFFGQMSPDGEDVMQYTGLKDRNGVEIYEGDIIRTAVRGVYRTLPGEVKQHPSGAWTVGEGGDLWHLNERCEVIGNIWENPELLEKQ